MAFQKSNDEQELSSQSKLWREQATNIAGAAGDAEAAASDAAAPAAAPRREDACVEDADRADSSPCSSADTPAESVADVQDGPSVSVADEAEGTDALAAADTAFDTDTATRADDAASQEREYEDTQDVASVDLDDTQDSLTFSNGVIEKIVALAMREVPGVVGMKGSWFNRVQDVLGASDSRKGVSVEVFPDASVSVTISVLIKYGAYAPTVFEDVKRVVVATVYGMTGLTVSGVNLRIEDVLTPEEYEAQDMRTAPQTPVDAGEEAPSHDAEAQQTASH